MNYSVLTIPPFDKQVKKLVKKYTSLKSEISILINTLKIEPKKGVSIGSDCYKLGWRSLQKIKENLEVRVLLLILLLQTKLFFYYQFTISHNSRTLKIKNWFDYLI